MSDAASLRVPVLAHADPRRRIVGVGVDVVDPSDVHASLTTFGLRYLRTLLSPEETSGLGDDDPTSRVAAAFGVKEGVTKILAPPADAPWPWPSIELVGGERPGELVLSCLAGDLARERGLSAVTLERRDRDEIVVVLVTGFGAAGQ